MTYVLTQADMPEAGMHTIPLYYCCLTPYDDKFRGLHILLIRKMCLRLLERWSLLSEKPASHSRNRKICSCNVFLQWRTGKEFAGENRILIASPKVATYDLKPEMSAIEVKDALVAELATGKHDMVILNFANGDMVGHTGVYDAIVKAVQTVDSCVGEVVRAARKAGYSVIITADHGNADYAVNEDGTPTQPIHSTKFPYCG